MSKKISWLDNFAESYKKGINKTASAKKGEEIILDRNSVKGAKLGDKVKLNNKMYRIADLDFEDEKGPGVVAEEIPMSLDSAEDPMAMEMGTPAHGTMENKCTVAPERAYTDAGNVFDLDVREQEQAKFESEANETAQHMQSEQSVDRTQRSTPIVLPSMGASEAPSMTDSMTPMAPAEQAPVEPATDSMMSEEPMVEEPVMEDDFEEEPEMSEEDDFEEADDLDIEKDEDTCPECGEDEENCECDSEEDEEEKLMASLAGNRILKRILASKRK